ncbi:MAG: hypothetical protein IT501_10915, partial [Rubrivivax sp.]|nr:hypothetical protein [Rubrivivax sp.]
SETHVGLRIMAERAQRLGATLQVQSRPGAGTTVTLQLPGVGAGAEGVPVVAGAAAVEATLGAA